MADFDGILKWAKEHIAPKHLGAFESWIGKVEEHYSDVEQVHIDRESELRQELESVEGEMAWLESLPEAILDFERGLLTREELIALARARSDSD